MDTLVLILDLVGTFVFALSGGVLAARHRLDLFGVLALAFATASVGGNRPMTRNRGRLKIFFMGFSKAVSLLNAPASVWIDRRRASSCPRIFLALYGQIPIRTITLR